MMGIPIFLQRHFALDWLKSQIIQLERERAEFRWTKAVIHFIFPRSIYTLFFSRHGSARGLPAAGERAVAGASEGASSRREPRAAQSQPRQRGDALCRVRRRHPPLLLLFRHSAGANVSCFFRLSTRGHQNVRV